MRQFLRAFLTFITFIVIAVICINSQWKWLDIGILGCCWAGFLFLSILVFRRSSRLKADGHQWQSYVGQTAGLPESWRRWIADDKDGSDLRRH